MKLSPLPTQTDRRLLFEVSAAEHCSPNDTHTHTNTLSQRVCRHINNSIRIKRCEVVMLMFPSRLGRGSLSLEHSLTVSATGGLSPSGRVPLFREWTRYETFARMVLQPQTDTIFLPPHKSPVDLLVFYRVQLRAVTRPLHSQNLLQPTNTNSL